ncbi:HAMP domain-containing sensor histidine kinase [Allofustis seminis]|uniref:HAMP domain-containing sensor histidine kinase n=1 Tax=Allofustis seminis TaxID=166939 RepID=UPI0014613011|nr:HAMP domain-containing histidine kinase [Allofustis seminis]
MYLFFTLLLIYNFKKWTLHNEKEELVELQVQIVNNLKQEGRQLDTQNIQKYINATPELGSEEKATENNHMDKGLSYPLKNISMYRQGYIVSIYNVEMQEIFSTQPHQYAVDRYRTDEVREVYENRKLTAFNDLMPVYSIFDEKELIGYVQVVNTLDRYEEMITHIHLLALILSTIVLLVSFGAGLLLSNSFMRPINRLISAMKEIQRNPESDIRLYEGKQANEIEKLAMTYNDMVDLMQRNIENQQQFVEDVSHELRTPISVVEGYLNMLNRWGKEDPNILEESITVSLQEIHRIKSMVQEMLSLSRAEQMMGRFTNDTTSLIEVVRQTHANFEMLYPDFLFTLDIDAKEPVIGQISQGHFEQILIILLENAVKYSKDRLEIHISLSTEIHYATLVIQDFGIGIGEKDLLNIFNRFYRVDKARSRASGGTGLGLPIAKQLIEGYGGTIQVDSVVDYGTIFRIRIPLAK